MLTVFAATFVLFLLIVGGMSLGYVFKRKACRAAAAASPHWGWRKSATARNLAMRAKSAKPKRHSGASSWTSTAFCSYSENPALAGFYLGLPKV